MAVSVRSVRLSNSGKRRRVLSRKPRSRAKVLGKRKNPAKRKLSPKQIAIFGTPRQKAALRASKTKKRNAGKFSVRKTLKRKRKVYAGSLGGMRSRLKQHGGSQAKPRKRRKNVGEIVSISLAGLAGNPGKRKRGSGMAKRRRRTRRNAGTAFGRSWSNYAPAKKRGKRKNSGVTRRRRRHTHTAVAKRRRRNPIYRVRRVGRRRNPGIASMFGGGLVIKAASIIGGAVATRYVTQMALGGNNTGYVGYLGNALAAFALGWATKKVLKNNEIGNNVMLGGAVSTVLRIIQDKTPYGQYVTSALSGMGKGGDVGIGIIQDSSFPVPQVNMPGSMTSFVTPRATRDYVGSQVSQVQATRAAMTKGVSGMGSGGRGARARGVA